MKKPEELTAWDFLDTVRIPDGYDEKEVPEATRRNFGILICEHNNLVEAFNAMAEFNGFNDFVNYDD